MGEIEEVSRAVENYKPKPRSNKKEYMKSWRAKNKQYLKEYYHQWYVKNRSSKTKRKV